MSFSLFGLFAGCAWVPPTVETDPSLEFVELGHYRFHVRTVGDTQLPPVIVVHGGPGGDSKYLVMTRLMNRAEPGGPSQCTDEAMPANAFERAGYAAFDNMLKPVLARPTSFSQDLTNGVAAYQGKLFMLSSECSFIGYRYQQEFHMSSMPTQTMHLQAVGMGHNMLTLNPAWSVAVVDDFFGSAPATGP